MAKKTLAELMALSKYTIANAVMPCSECMREGYFQPIGGRRSMCNTCNRYNQRVIRRRHNLALEMLTEEQRRIIDSGAKVETYVTMFPGTRWAKQAIEKYKDGEL